MSYLVLGFVMLSSERRTSIFYKNMSHELTIDSEEASPQLAFLEHCCAYSESQYIGGKGSTIFRASDSLDVPR